PHDPCQHSGADDARLSQRDSYRTLDHKQRLEGTRYAGRGLHHSGEEQDLLLKEVPKRADAQHAATYLGWHRHAFRSASWLRRQPRLCPSSLRFLAVTL